MIISLRGIILTLQVILLATLIVLLVSEKQRKKKSAFSLCIISIILALILAILCMFTDNIISAVFNIIIVGIGFFTLTKL